MNLWIRAVQSDYLLFVHECISVLLLHVCLHRFSWVCSDTPPGDDTQFLDRLISRIDYKNICENTENATVTFP